MDFYGLIISSIIASVLLIYLFKKKNKSQLHKIFIVDITLVFLWDIFILLQNILCKEYFIDPFYFECFVYVFACSLPVSVFFTGLIFANTKIKFKKSYLLLFVIPIISLLTLWTNDSHHLFYEVYSLNLNETITGPFGILHIVYTYSVFAISIIYLLKYSIKNAGFFSKQSLFFIFGALIPVLINILGVLKIFPMTVYITPISFTLAMLFFAIAIFKFKFLGVTPIAMQKVVDRMSDSFIVVNEDNTITDFNDAFLKAFNVSAAEVRNVNFMKFLQIKRPRQLNLENVINALEKCKHTTNIVHFMKECKIQDKYFNIEAGGIYSKGNFLGTLILLKDVTQHVIDKNIIEDNQSLLMEKERLASLGQMIGGIAHNLKTPIMSISGAAEGLKDLTKEYDISIGDPTVTNEDHHAIVKDMNEWIEKIKTHTSYMSDVITAVKGQAVAFSETETYGFTISELLTHVDVLMKHELKNALIDLKTDVLVPETLSIKGNINSLVQVINNIISNGIQAYNGRTNETINFTISSKGKNVIFSIEDHGSGMPKKVQDKLFKEMITTKGKNGTGLGLFMSYSNIRAHFNGAISFTSKEGKGTKFDITIPIK